MLTAAAGATNALSLTRLGGVPASIMTANLVLFGLSATRDQGTLGWHAGTLPGTSLPSSLTVTGRLISAKSVFNHQMVE
jgi:hypothetical protein